MSINHVGTYYISVAHLPLCLKFGPALDQYNARSIQGAPMEGNLFIGFGSILRGEAFE